MFLLQLPLEEKIAVIAREIYGADGIKLEPQAEKRLELFKKQVRGVFSWSAIKGSFRLFLV